MRDKSHSWDKEGLNTLIPNGIALGLVGYPFICPDMIGGGIDKDFLADDFKLDQELFVRYVQCSALFPMMQFSRAPCSVLSKENLQYCQEAVKIHEKFSNTILNLAKESAKTGEPILRNLEYVFPNRGYDNVKDQFMLGDNVMVAPILEKNKFFREVLIPEGDWIDDFGTIVEGPCKIKINSLISRLPYYIKK